jgi:hypothetical protein
MRTVGLDLEVGNVFNDFSIWDTKRPLQITTVAIAEDEPWVDQTFQAKSFPKSTSIWSGQLDANNIAKFMSPRTALQIAQLLWAWHQAGCTIVTWNGIAFDFVVLADAAGAAAFDCLKEVALGAHHVDMMFNLFMHLGYNVPLKATAQETIGLTKQGLEHGQDAPLVWALGRHEEVLKYCANDARITLDLYNKADKTGVIRWRTRGGRGSPRALGRNRYWSPTWPVARMLEREPPPLATFLRRPPTLKGFLERWDKPLKKKLILP